MKRRGIVSAVITAFFFFHTGVSVMAQGAGESIHTCGPECAQDYESWENSADEAWIEECGIAYDEFEAEVGQLQSENDEDREYIAVEPGGETEYEYQTCRLIVKATDEITDEDAIGCAGPYNGIYVFQYEDESDTRAADMRMDVMDEVEFSEPDRVYSIPEEEKETAEISLLEGEGQDKSLCGLSDSLGLGSDWGADACSFSDMWDILLEKYGSAEQMPEITVADVDTGINYSHECFENRISEYGFDFLGRNEIASDEHGHGTQVASIIAQNTPSNVKIVPLKTFNTQEACTDLSLYLAVEYAIEVGIDIINMSFGGYGLDSVTDLFMRDAIDAGIIVIAAYGNYSDETQDFYPACYPGAIGVSAVNQSETLASFSNYGAYVDLAAPGENLSAAVVSGKTGYISVSGTSFASPYVASAAALLLTYEPQSSSGAIASALYGNAKDIGAKGWDTYYGYGLLSFADIQLDEWIPVSVYNVDFVVNGGTPIAACSILGGEKLAQPSVPSREGYHFLGWYTERYYLRRYDFTRPVSSNLVLYAKWENHSYTSSNIRVISTPTYTSPGVSEIRCRVCNQVIQTLNKARLSLAQPSVKAVKNSAKGIAISWKKVNGATGYYIYRKSGNGSWKKIKTVTSAAALSYTDSKAKNGKNYTYRIRAFNKVQASSYSATYKMCRIKSTQLSTPKRTKKGMKLKWKKTASVSGYLIYRRTLKGSWKKIASVKGAKTVSYVDKKAKKGKKYEYRIRAYKIVGGTKYYSAYT